MRGRPSFTHKCYEGEPVINGCVVLRVASLSVSDPSLKAYPMGDVKQAVPSISTAVEKQRKKQGMEVSQS